MCESLHLFLEVPNHLNCSSASLQQFSNVPVSGLHSRVFFKKRTEEGKEEKKGKWEEMDKKKLKKKGFKEEREDEKNRVQSI